MDGIFSYYVPNRSINTGISSNTRTNTYQNTNTGTQSSFCLQNNERANSRQLFGLNDNVRNLVQQLLHGFGNQASQGLGGANQRPPTDVTTLAMGEEDGGIGNQPPQITTLAMGEEDGGATC